MRGTRAAGARGTSRAGSPGSSAAKSSKLAGPLPVSFDGAPPVVRLNDPKKMKVSIKRFGREKNPILVVDNVLANAEEIREYGLGHRFIRATIGRSYYPGYQSTSSLRGIDTLGEWAARVLWTKGFGLDPENRVSMLNDVLTDTFFAMFSPAKTYKYGNVHTDGHSWLALLVYLTPGEDHYSGTGFWRHAPTGLESACSSPEPFNVMTKLDAMFKTRMVEGSRTVLSKFPHMSYMAFLRSLFRDVAMPPPFPARDHPPWENIGIVPARFNRLVVYPTWQFHGVVMLREKTAITKDTARLTLNTFIKHPALEEFDRNPVAQIEGLDSSRRWDAPGAQS
jgi:hypothetical protein